MHCRKIKEKYVTPFFFKSFLCPTEVFRIPIPAAVSIYFRWYWPIVAHRPFFVIHVTDMEPFCIGGDRWSDVAVGLLDVPTFQHDFS